MAYPITGSYVKFIRGTFKAWKNLKVKDPDTLYFISEKGAHSGFLYLGDKLISSSGGVSTLNLSDLKDISLSEEIEDGSALVYNAETELWEDRKPKENIYIKTTAEWNSAMSLKSEKNVIYIYSDYFTMSDGSVVPGYKIGDGESYLFTMPILNQVYFDHMTNTDIHTSLEEKEYWNNKVSVTLEEEEELIKFKTKKEEEEEENG